MPPTLHYVLPARFLEGPPPWKDDTWSLACDFDVPPAEQESASIASVRFLVPAAPHGRLRSGATLWLYEGASLVATAEILD